MKFRILRYEKAKDRDNNDEIFIAVEIDDGTAVYNRSEWLTSFETQQLLEDESLLNHFAQQIAERGKVAHIQQPPQVDLG